MGKEVVSDHEFVKVNEHKSHLFMNVLAMDVLCKKKIKGSLCEYLSVFKYTFVNLPFEVC